MSLAKRGQPRKICRAALYSGLLGVGGAQLTLAKEVNEK